MTADTSALAAPADDTVAHALQDGLALALKAEDEGDWKGVCDWLARHPSCAIELAEFLAGQRGIRPLVAPLRPPASPTAVGKYELREVLGKGAMGVVHRASDLVLKREVAVKLLHPGGELSADDRARFRFEAEAMAALNHDHVVPVLDAGEADGVPYLVMPLLTGGSLAGWLKAKGEKAEDRQLAPKQAAGIARDIALGVHHAHQQGLIHRDLKPANILRDDAGGVRVADFGLARMSDATATKMAGTPAYMAPEQVSGGKRLTTAVDVHAVGAILFELLAGGPPFGGKDVGSVLDKVKNETPALVRTHRPDVPRDLEAIVARCLEKKPEERYPSALALADDLDNFLNGRTVRGSERGRFEEFTRLFARDRTDQPINNHLGHLIGALATFAFQAGATVALLLGQPVWAFAALLADLTVWGLMFLLFIWVRAGRLNPAERASGVVKFWAMAALLCLVPFAVLGPELLLLYPASSAVVALCILSHGPIHGGREFLGGIGLLVAAAVMPFLPSWAWPACFAVAWGGWALWYSLRMRAHAAKLRVEAAT
jgi:hypothetical protein